MAGFRHRAPAFVDISVVAYPSVTLLIDLSEGEGIVHETQGRIERGSVVAGLLPGDLRMTGRGAGECLQIRLEPVAAAMVFGASAELSGTVWATALTRESSVVRHVLVRVAAYIGASWLGYIVAVAAWSGFVYFFADGSGGPELSVWLGIAWKLILVAAAWAALGLGAVSLIRSVGPAIGAVLGFYFLESFLSLWDPYETISATAASAALFGIDVPPMLEDFVPGAGMSVTHAALVLIGWTVVGTLLTWLGLGKRDA